MLAVVDHLGLDRPLGFGHSCGGAALLLAEEARPGTFDALYCFEPVVYPGEVPASASTVTTPCRWAPAAAPPPSRPVATPSANFSGKAPFDRLDPEALAAYVDNGFAPAEDGTIALRCRREHESEVYAHALAHDAFAHFPDVRCPVTLGCGANTDSFGVDFLARLAARLPHPTTAVVAGIGHFGPLEDPVLVAASVRRALVRPAVTPPA